MDMHASAIIKHKKFSLLNANVLEKIIARDSFYAPEIDIFKAVHSWIKSNPDTKTDEILSK